MKTVTSSTATHWPSCPSGSGFLALIPALADLVPYAVAVVELDGAPGTRLVGAVVDTDLPDVRIARRVVVVWDDLDDQLTIPRFAVIPA